MSLFVWARRCRRRAVRCRHVEVRRHAVHDEEGDALSAHDAGSGLDELLARVRDVGFRRNYGAELQQAAVLVRDVAGSFPVLTGTAVRLPLGAGGGSRDVAGQASPPATLPAARRGRCQRWQGRRGGELAAKRAAPGLRPPAPREDNRRASGAAAAEPTSWGPNAATGPARDAFAHHTCDVVRSARHTRRRRLTVCASATSAATTAPTATAWLVRRPMVAGRGGGRSADPCPPARAGLGARGHGRSRGGSSKGGRLGERGGARRYRC